MGLVHCPEAALAHPNTTRKNLEKEKLNHLCVFVRWGYVCYVYVHIDACMCIAGCMFTCICICVEARKLLSSSVNSQASL